MPSRLVNSFNLLAIILLAIGVVGACSGGRMVFDPGRASSGKEWIVYLVAGALMLVNGFLPAANPPDAKATETATNAKSPAASDTASAASSTSAND